jgi:hypothetical protein
MKKILFSILLLISISSFGQSFKDLKVYCTDAFDPKVSITVRPPQSDGLDLAGALKNSLVTNDFKVISETVAKEQIELVNKKQTSDTTSNQEISAGKTTYIKSVYLITFNYKYDEYTYHPHVDLNLSGQVVDLANDGAIVATFSFRKNMFATKKISALMENIALALKEKRKSK